MSIERRMIENPDLEVLLRAERPVLVVGRLARRQTRSSILQDRPSGDGFGGRIFEPSRPAAGARVQKTESNIGDIV